MSDNLPININVENQGLGEYSKPVSLLIEKISKAAAVYFEPHLKIKNAKADAKVALIRANSYLDTKDVADRAAIRLREIELRKQLNIESVVEKAIPLVEDHANPDYLDDDWIFRFFGSAQDFSDEHAQDWWAKVLAGEANNPGSFSRKTLGVLSEMDKRDAALFEELISKSAKHERFIPLIYETKKQNNEIESLTFDELTHLEFLGLLIVSGSHHYSFSIDRIESNRFYFGKNKFIVVDRDSVGGVFIDVGMVFLTTAGQQIARLCSCDVRDSFLDAIAQQWRSQGLVVEIKNHSDSTENN